MYSLIRRVLALTIALSALSWVSAVRADHHENKEHEGHHDAAAHSSKSGETISGLINGEVRRIDAENRKVTIRHDAIPEFDMAAMTMVFGVVDTISLDHLKPGDKIRFSVKKSQGKWLVTAIEH